MTISESELADRRNYLGGSDMPILLGLSRFKSAYALACEKAGIVEPDTESTERMRAGSCMELGIEEWCRQEWGWDMAEDQEEGRVHPDYPFIRGHVDRLKLDDDGEPTHVLEFKNIDIGQKKEWYDGIPVQYQVQLYAYMSIYELPGILVACFGGNQFEQYELERNTKVENQILGAAKKFWEDIQEEILPSPDGSKSSSRALSLIYPDHDDDLVTGTDDMLKCARAYKEALAREKDAKERKELFGNTMKDLIADHVGISFDNGSKVTWKKSKDREYVDLADLKERFPDVAAEVIQTRPGSRTLRVTVKD